MYTLAKFFVTGKPVPKGRPRAFRVGSSIRMYTDRQTQQWEHVVGLQAKAHANRRQLAIPLVGPLVVELTFQVRRPKTVKHQYPATDRSDVDNLAKAVLDGMQAVGLMRDDRQVVDLISRKRYADDGQEGVVVSLRRPPDTPEVARDLGH